MKAESSRIFDALEHGRRVLISRYGKVVAAIDPASPDRHARLLAAYATPDYDEESELTATEIGQGSPSERIRAAAEDGVVSLVTRDRKVYGVLTPFVTGEEDLLLSDPDVQERLLARFEEEQPNASPAEFAAEVERVTGAAAGAAVPGVDYFYSLGLHPGVTRTVDADLGLDVDGRLWVEAKLLQGVALERSGQTGRAEEAVDSLMSRLSDRIDPHTADRRRRTVAVQRARMRVALGDPEGALELLDTVVDALDHELATTGTSVPVERASVASA